MPSFRRRVGRVFEKTAGTVARGRARLRWRHLALLGGLLVLIAAAVIIARGDASEEIAEDARVLSWAESVTSTAAVLRGDVREGLVIGQSAARGVFEENAVTGSVERIREVSSELAERSGVLAQLGAIPDSAEAGQVVAASAEELAVALESEQITEALSIAETDLMPALEDLSAVAASVSERRADHIVALTAGVGTITTAARFVSALLIPILAVYVLYRAMRSSQRVSLLRSELSRERELRRKKDSFIAAASHHIRTPLASVVGFSELLRDGSADINMGVRKEIIDLMAMEAEETANVVDDLLVAARYDLDQLDMKEDELEVRAVIDDATSDWETRQRMRLTVSGNAVIIGDERWLAHAIRNLLRNAASFGGEQIRVDIRTVLNRVVIEIADNGEAIPAEERDKIFELYYSYDQIEGLAPSLGLGLSVARRITRAMGGELDFYRVDGENVFELKLPRAQVASSAVPVRTIDPAGLAPDLDEIRLVIERGGPDIAYQPIIDLDASRPGERKVVGYEALARFGSFSTPSWFQAAGDLEVHLELELVCIARAISDFDPPEKDAFLAVNLSDRTLRSTRLEEAIEGIDPTRLVLELSEAASIRSYEETRRMVAALAARGIRLAIDNVGDGDGGLWHMARIGAHMIKIDMSLVRELRDSLRSRALVRAISAMAEELGTPVIAEGVENEEERTVLGELGVGFGQGHLFGLPAWHCEKEKDYRAS